MRSPEPVPRRLVRCDVCGRSYLLTAADLQRFAEQGWPTCHGREMGHFAEAERPNDPPPRPK